MSGFRTMRLTCAALFAFMACGTPGLCATRNVLVLYDERRELPGLAVIDSSLTRALASSPERVEIYRESMDNSRFGSPDYQNVLRDYLRAKYAGKRIDVAVAVLDPALEFLLSQRATLFKQSPEVPIVFCGIDRSAFEGRRLPAGVTGVFLKRRFTPTLELALNLHPDTKRIVVVGGTSAFDTIRLNQAREEFRTFENRLAFTYSTGKPMREVLSELSHLPPHTLVLYTTMFRDGAGEAHVPHEAVEQISAAANAPVYGFVDQYLGRGIVGGHLYSLAKHGQAAGGLVLKILAGNSAAELQPIEPENSVTLFDWQQLRRWNISESSLPPGSTIQFREPTAWQSYKGRFIVAAAVVLVEGATIFILLTNLIRRRRVEKSLAESEERFRVAANGAPVMIWMDGTDKACTFVNKAWLEFTGRTLEQELGNGWTESLHPDDLAKSLKTYEEAFDARREFTMEFRLRRQNGDYAWILASGTPRFVAGGAFAGYVGSATDITEVKQAHERLRSVVEGAPNAMLMVDTNGKITLVNARTEQLFRYTRAELIGSSVNLLLPKDWRADPSENGRSVAGNGAPCAPGTGHELSGQRKDGSQVPLEIGLNPIRTPEGEFVLASIVDIGERRAAEAKLRESEKRMTMAADAAHLGMWVWDASENHVWTSAKWKAIHGYLPDEDIRFDALHQRVHPEDRERVGRAVTNAVRQHGAFFVEHRIVLPDGKVRWISTSGRVEETAQPGPLRLLGISMDVTERKEAEEAVREVSGKLITAQEDERRRIARDLHDDLNQRLAMLSVDADLLGRMNHDPEAQPLIEGIGSRVRSLSTEVHKLSYQLHPAKLEQLGFIAATRSFCHELSNQVGIPVDFVYDALPRDLASNVALCLYRIVQEALQNVAKHSRATRARVEVKREGDDIRLLISDNGRGFDMGIVQRHAGLGLVGMRERVRLVRGDFSFHSEPGQGVRIEVVVPMSLNSTAA